MDFANLRIRDIAYAVKYTPQQTKWESKNRPDHIIGITLSGNSFHNFFYQTFSLVENCIFFFNQKDAYAVNVLEKGLSYSVHFTTYEPIETDTFCVKIKDNTEILSLLKKIERQKVLTTNGDSDAMSSLYRLCGLYNRIYQKNYAPTNSRIIQAKEYIDLNLKEENCLDAAAEIYGTTRRRFNDVFKQYFDITPNRYVITKKINLACRLLTSEYLSVGEVAELCGFHDIYYFSKVFKEETGILPSKYKQ